MALVVDCPSCTRKLRLPTDLLGRTVKCASCGGTFEAKESVAPPPAPSSRETPAPERPSRRTRRLREGFDFSDDDPERCPRCGEDVGPGWSRCRHCGEALDEEEDRPWERGVRRDCEPHRGGLLLTLGIVSIVCGALGIVAFCCPLIGVVMAAAGLSCGIPAWYMGHGDLAMMRSGVRDPRGRGQTQGGWICAIIGVLLNVLAILVAIGMGALMFLPPLLTPTPTTPPPRVQPAPQNAPRRMNFNPDRPFPAPFPQESWQDPTRLATMDKTGP